MEERYVKVDIARFMVCLVLWVRVFVSLKSLRFAQEGALMANLVAQRRSRVEQRLTTVLTSKFSWCVEITYSSTAASYFLQTRLCLRCLPLRDWGLVSQNIRELHLHMHGLVTAPVLRHCLRKVGWLFVYYVVCEEMPGWRSASWARWIKLEMDKLSKLSNLFLQIWYHFVLVFQFALKLFHCILYKG